MFYIFIFESVFEGYFDKVCDCVLDVIVDFFLLKDLEVCVVCEILMIINQIILVGEVCCVGVILDDEIEVVVCNVVCDIGYEQVGFYWEKFVLQNFLYE